MENETFQISSIKLLKKIIFLDFFSVTVQFMKWARMEKNYFQPKKGLSMAGSSQIHVDLLNYSSLNLRNVNFPRRHRFEESEFRSRSEGIVTGFLTFLKSSRIVYDLVISI